MSALLGRALARHPPPALVVSNFRGLHVPAVGGITLAGALLAGEVVFAAAGPSPAFHSRVHAGLLVVALAFFALGLFDDAAGSGRARGFRGHLGALREGRVTSGLVKAAGGGAAALVAATLWRGSMAAAIPDALVVALAANLVNLLDVRPGRAVKGFFLAWAPLAAAGTSGVWLPFSAMVAGAAAAWLPADLRERRMLGDAGANVLGAVAGAGLALTLGPAGRLAALAVLAALTVLSERWSFTAAIEKVGPLRWLDGLGRVPQGRGE